MDYNHGMSGYEEMDAQGHSNGEQSDGTTPGGPDRQHSTHYGHPAAPRAGNAGGAATGSSPARQARMTRATVAAAEEAARHGGGGNFGVSLGTGLNIDMGGEMSMGHGGVDGDRTPLATEQESEDDQGEEDESGMKGGVVSSERQAVLVPEGQEIDRARAIANGHFHHGQANGRDQENRPDGSSRPAFSASAHRGNVVPGSEDDAQEAMLNGRPAIYGGPSTASPADGQQMSANGHHAHHPESYPYPYPTPPMVYGYPPYRPAHDHQASPMTPGSSSYPTYSPMPPQPGFMGPPGPVYVSAGYPPPQSADSTHSNAPKNVGYHYPPYGYPTHNGYGNYNNSGDGGIMAPPGVVFARSQNMSNARPKVKLTYEDKRRIVEIARSHSSLRQEDIAQQYGVDRSTISKILISAHRWTGPPQPPVQPIIKPSQSKSAGGRFPAIEQRMHEWMDAQFSAGYEIRDNVARDKAKDIARVMGFTEERFKASAKWLDKFKERRKQNGQRASVTATYESNLPNLESASDGVPMPSPTPPSATAFAVPSHSAYYGMSGYHMADGLQSGSGSPATGPGQFLSRSQSSATLASSDSSGLDPYGLQAQQLQHQQNHPHYQQISGRTMHQNHSESDMMSVQSSIAGDVGMSESGHSSRHRSRSSPRLRPNLELTEAEPGQMDPASGRAPKMQSNAGMHRHNSMHAITSPSPRRPGGLHRTQSSTSSVSNRKSHRPASLAASAFGLTPLQSPQQHDDFSPHHSPNTATAGGPGLHHSFSHGMSNMNMHSSITSSTSSLLSNQTTGSSGGQPMTPAHPAGLFTNHVLESRAAEPHYYNMPHSAGPEQVQYAYAYGHHSGYGSQPTSAGIPQKGEVSWGREEQRV